MFNFLYRLKLFQILERFCERYSHLRDYLYVWLNKADDFLGLAPTSQFSRVSSQWPWSAVIDSLVYICFTIDNALLKFTPLLSQALGWGSRDACAVHWRHVCDSLTLSSFSAIGGKCWTWLTGWSQDVCCVTWL